MLEVREGEHKANECFANVNEVEMSWEEEEDTETREVGGIWMVGAVETMDVEAEEWDCKPCGGEEEIFTSSRRTGIWQKKGGRFVLRR